MAIWGCLLISCLEGTDWRLTPTCQKITLLLLHRSASPCLIAGISKQVPLTERLISAIWKMERFLCRLFPTFTPNHFIPLFSVPGSLPFWLLTVLSRPHFRVSSLCLHTPIISPTGGHTHLHCCHLFALVGNLKFLLSEKLLFLISDFLQFWPTPALNWV